MPLIELLDITNDYKETVVLEEIRDKSHFMYQDDLNNSIEVFVYDDGIVLNKKTKDYELCLHLRKEAFVEIFSLEGKLKINAKVVEFCTNNDILVMHYFFEGEEKIYRVTY